VALSRFRAGLDHGLRPRMGGCYSCGKLVEVSESVRGKKPVKPVEAPNSWKDDRRPSVDKELSTGKVPEDAPVVNGTVARITPVTLDPATEALANKVVADAVAAALPKTPLESIGSSFGFGKDASASKLAAACAPGEVPLIEGALLKKEGPRYVKRYAVYFSSTRTLVFFKSVLDAR